MRNVTYQPQTIFSLGGWSPQIPMQPVAAPYSGKILQPQHASLAGLGTSLFTLYEDFEVFR